MSKIDYDKTRRWLLGLAERQVMASGSRATFTSDMFFDAAEAIKTLREENAAMAEAAEPFIQDYTDEWDQWPDDAGVDVSATVGQVRALRSALSKGGLRDG